MKKQEQPKITLIYHPNKALGACYEVSRITGTVLVKFNDPEKQRLVVRVNDHLSEEQALSLADVAEVTTLQEH